MCDPGVVIERKASKKWVWDDQYYTHEKQVGVVNVLYTNSSNTLLDNDGIPDAKIPTMQFFRSEIDKKCKGYRAQDTEHAIYDDRYFVSVDDVIERMVACKLRCYYCKHPVELIYREAHSRKQWTLDRINNDIGHNADNVVIACLDCNLRRGTMDSDRFKQGKQFRFVKCESGGNDYPRLPTNN